METSLTKAMLRNNLNRGTCITGHLKHIVRYVEEDADLAWHHSTVSYISFYFWVLNNHHLIYVIIQACIDRTRRKPDWNCIQKCRTKCRKKATTGEDIIGFNPFNRPHIISPATYNCNLRYLCLVKLFILLTNLVRLLKYVHFQFYEW